MFMIMRVMLMTVRGTIMVTATSNDMNSTLLWLIVLLTIVIKIVRSLITPK